MTNGYDPGPYDVPDHVEAPPFASAYATPLIALGNCNAATARALTAALRKAADR